jgi:hypothetical protein
MGRHCCPRCGFESSRDMWWDRHPALAVLFALPAGYTLIGVILAYPWFFVPLMVVVCAVIVDRRQRRRAAIAARADHDHREMMMRAVIRGPGGSSPLSAKLPPVVGRRATDRWSITQPTRGPASR